MTEQEKALIAACGEFCHVTTAARRDLVNAVGLDPEYDESLVIRGPKRDKAVYLCPATSIAKALDFIGARADDQPKLYVYWIGAAALSQKNCGPDIGYMVNIVEEHDYTVEVSLQCGTIACYEAIDRGELTDPVEAVNPRYLPPGG
jgi:hypothetical protein